MKRFAWVLLILVFAAFATGCDWFAGGDDEDTEALILPFSTLFEDCHIVSGYSVDSGTSGYYYVYFDDPFDYYTFIAGDIIYLISGDDVYPFYFYATLVNSDDETVVGITGIPYGWDGDEIEGGTIIWKELDSWAMYSPNLSASYPSTIYDDMDRIGSENWGTDVDTDTLDFVILGGNDDALFVWLAEPPDADISDDDDFDRDWETIQCGPVLYLDGEYALERTFEVEGGIDYTTINCVDFSADGLPNLVSFQLLGEDAPVYAYARAPENLVWYWVGQIN